MQGCSESAHQLLCVMSSLLHLTHCIGSSVADLILHLHPSVSEVSRE